MSVIGVDIGGTNIKAGRLGASATIDAETECPTPASQGPEALVRVLMPIVRELAGGVPVVLGVGCAGLVDSGEGRVRASPNLPAWKDVPLGDMLAKALGKRPVVLNDANAFVLAECRRGAGRGADTVVGLAVGTGVGGGLFMGGRLWCGSHGFAGELGHVPLIADGPLCACGARGCLESLVGTRAILRRYLELSGRPEGAAWTPLRVAERAWAGDEAALETYRETGRLLGLALAGLTHILDPDLFLLGGGVAGAADLLLPAARASLAEAVLYPPDLVPPIRTALLGPSAGWIGAALAALEAETPA